LRVREVLAKSPAARAGFQAGDVLSSFDARSTADRAQVEERLDDHAPGENVRVEWKRGARIMAATIPLERFPDDVAGTARLAPPAKDGDGIREQFEAPFKYWTYRSREHSARVAHGLVLWMGGPPTAIWAGVCREHRLVLAGVEGDRPRLAALAALLRKRWPLDASRTVVVGPGAKAEEFALAYPQLVHGVVAEHVPCAFPPGNPPIRLAYFFLARTSDRLAEEAVRRARERGVPVVVRQGANLLNSPVVADAIGRWTDWIGAL
jgi:hypothetical protein